MKQVELGPQPAMVPLARLLQTLQVGVQIGLVVEGRAIDPCQLLVVLVASPVGPGEAGQLDRLDRLRVLQMRPAAEVGEVALLVEGDLAIGAIDQLDLVGLALAHEAAARLLARYLLAVPLSPFGDLFLQLRLDPFEIGFRDRLWEVEVVIEAVLDRWPDRDLDARIESADGLGEQVCGRMPKDIERVRVVLVPRRQDLDLLAVPEGLAQVLNLAVPANQNRLLGELWPDRGSGLEAGRAVRKFKFRVVGKDDFHGRAGYFRHPERQRPLRGSGPFNPDGRTGRARAS